jgi:hypothetical protein
VSALRLTAADVGQRVSVRSRLPDPAPAGPTLTDTIGYLRSWTGDRVEIERKDGVTVYLAAADIVAGKVLGPPPRRRTEPN